MAKDEAKLRFQDADRLFKHKEFDAALRILMELNAEYPNERHILYPMARCLTGLKRFPEAREVAEHLVKKFRYAPAQELADRIDQMQTFDYPDVKTPALPSGLESILDTPASIGASGPPPLPRSANAAPAGAWQPYVLWIGLAAISYIIMILIGRTFAPPVTEWQEALVRVSEDDGGEFPPAPMQALALLGLANIQFSYFLSCFPSFWALKTVGALRYDDFGENMKDAAVITLIGFALTFVVFIGWIGFLVVLKRRYEMSFGQLVASVLLFFLFDLLVTVPTAIVYNLAIA